MWLPSVSIRQVHDFRLPAERQRERERKREREREQTVAAAPPGSRRGGHAGEVWGERIKGSDAETPSQIPAEKRGLGKALIEGALIPRHFAYGSLQILVQILFTALLFCAVLILFLLRPFQRWLVPLFLRFSPPLEGSELQVLLPTGIICDVARLTTVYDGRSKRFIVRFHNIAVLAKNAPEADGFPDSSLSHPSPSDRENGAAFPSPLSRNREEKAGCGAMQHGEVETMQIKGKMGLVESWNVNDGVKETEARPRSRGDYAGSQRSPAVNHSSSESEHPRIEESSLEESSVEELRKARMRGGLTLCEIPEASVCVELSAHCFLEQKGRFLMSFHLTDLTKGIMMERKEDIGADVAKSHSATDPCATKSKALEVNFPITLLFDQILPLLAPSLVTDSLEEENEKRDNESSIHTFLRQMRRLDPNPSLERVTDMLLRHLFDVGSRAFRIELAPSAFPQVNVTIPLSMGSQKRATTARLSLFDLTAALDPASRELRGDLKHMRVTFEAGDESSKKVSLSQGPESHLSLTAVSFSFALQPVPLSLTHSLTQCLPFLGPRYVSGPRSVPVKKSLQMLLSLRSRRPQKALLQGEVGSFVARIPSPTIIEELHSQVVPSFVDRLAAPLGAVSLSPVNPATSTSKSSSFIFQGICKITDLRLYPFRLSSEGSPAGGLVHEGDELPLVQVAGFLLQQPLLGAKPSFARIAFDSLEASKVVLEPGLEGALRKSHSTEDHQDWEQNGAATTSMMQCKMKGFELTVQKTSLELALRAFHLSARQTSDYHSDERYRANLPTFRFQGLVACPDFRHGNFPAIQTSADSEMEDTFELCSQFENLTNPSAGQSFMTPIDTLESLPERQSIKSVPTLSSLPSNSGCQESAQTLTRPQSSILATFLSPFSPIFSSVARSPETITLTPLRHAPVQTLSDDASGTDFGPTADSLSALASMPRETSEISENGGEVGLCADLGNFQLRMAKEWRNLTFSLDGPYILVFAPNPKISHSKEQLDRTMSEKHAQSTLSGSLTLGAGFYASAIKLLESFVDASRALRSLDSNSNPPPLPIPRFLLDLATITFGEHGLDPGTLAFRIPHAAMKASVPLPSVPTSYCQDLPGKAGSPRAGRIEADLYYSNLGFGVKSEGGRTKVTVSAQSVASHEPADEPAENRRPDRLSATPPLADRLRVCTTCPVSMTFDLPAFVLKDAMAAAEAAKGADVRNAEEAEKGSKVSLGRSDPDTETVGERHQGLKFAAVFKAEGAFSVELSLPSLRSPASSGAPEAPSFTWVYKSGMSLKIRSIVHSPCQPTFAALPAPAKARVSAPSGLWLLQLQSVDWEVPGDLSVCLPALQTFERIFDLLQPIGSGSPEPPTWIKLETNKAAFAYISQGELETIISHAAFNMRTRSAGFRWHLRADEGEMVIKEATFCITGAAKSDSSCSTICKHVQQGKAKGSAIDQPCRTLRSIALGEAHLRWERKRTQGEDNGAYASPMLLKVAMDSAIFVVPSCSLLELFLDENEKLVNRMLRLYLEDQTLHRSALSIDAKLRHFSASVASDVYESLKPVSNSHVLIPRVSAFGLDPRGLRPPLLGLAVYLRDLHYSRILPTIQDGCEAENEPLTNAFEGAEDRIDFALSSIFTFRGQPIDQRRKTLWHSVPTVLSSAVKDVTTASRMKRVMEKTLHKLGEAFADQYILGGAPILKDGPLFRLHIHAPHTHARGGQEGHPRRSSRLTETKSYPERPPGLSHSFVSDLHSQGLWGKLCTVEITDQKIKTDILAQDAHCLAVVVPYYKVFVSWTANFKAGNKGKPKDGAEACRPLEKRLYDGIRPGPSKYWSFFGWRPLGAPGAFRVVVKPFNLNVDVLDATASFRCASVHTSVTKFSLNLGASPPEATPRAIRTPLLELSTPLLELSLGKVALSVPKAVSAKVSGISLNVRHTVSRDLSSDGSHTVQMTMDHFRWRTLSVANLHTILGLVLASPSFDLLGVENSAPQLFLDARWQHAKDSAIDPLHGISAYRDQRRDEEEFEEGEGEVEGEGEENGDGHGGGGGLRDWSSAMSLASAVESQDRSFEDRLRRPMLPSSYEAILARWAKASTAGKETSQGSEVGTENAQSSCCVKVLHDRVFLISYLPENGPQLSLFRSDLNSCLPLQFGPGNALSMASNEADNFLLSSDFDLRLAHSHGSTPPVRVRGARPPRDVAEWLDARDTSFVVLPFATSTLLAMPRSQLPAERSGERRVANREGERGGRRGSGNGAAVAAAAEGGGRNALNSGRGRRHRLRRLFPRPLTPRSFPLICPNLYTLTFSHSSHTSRLPAELPHPVFTEALPSEEGSPGALCKDDRARSRSPSPEAISPSWTEKASPILLKCERRRNKAGQHFTVISLVPRWFIRNCLPCTIEILDGPSLIRGPEGGSRTGLKVSALSSTSLLTALPPRVGLAADSSSESIFDTTPPAWIDLPAQWGAGVTFTYETSRGAVSLQKVASNFGATSTANGSTLVISAEVALWWQPSSLRPLLPRSQAHNFASHLASHADVRWRFTSAQELRSVKLLRLPPTPTASPLNGRRYDPGCMFPKSTAALYSASFDAVIDRLAASAVKPAAADGSSQLEATYLVPVLSRKTSHVADEMPPEGMLVFARAATSHSSPLVAVMAPVVLHDLCDALHSFDLHTLPSPRAVRGHSVRDHSVRVHSVRVHRRLEVFVGFDDFVRRATFQIANDSLPVHVRALLRLPTLTLEDFQVDEDVEVEGGVANREVSDARLIAAVLVPVYGSSGFICGSSDIWSDAEEHRSWTLTDLKVLEIRLATILPKDIAVAGSMSRTDMGVHARDLPTSSTAPLKRGTQSRADEAVTQCQRERVRSSSPELSQKPMAQRLLGPVILSMRNFPTNTALQCLNGKTSLRSSRESLQSILVEEGVLSEGHDRDPPERGQRLIEREGNFEVHLRICLGDGVCGAAGLQAIRVTRFPTLSSSNKTSDDRKHLFDFSTAQIQSVPDIALLLPNLDAACDNLNLSLLLSSPGMTTSRETGSAVNGQRITESGVTEISVLEQPVDLRKLLNLERSGAALPPSLQQRTRILKSEVRVPRQHLQPLSRSQSSISSANATAASPALSPRPSLSPRQTLFHTDVSDALGRDTHGSKGHISGRHVIHRAFSHSGSTLGAAARSATRSCTTERPSDKKASKSLIDIKKTGQHWLDLDPDDLLPVVEGTVDTNPKEAQIPSLWSLRGDWRVKRILEQKKQAFVVLKNRLEILVAPSQNAITLRLTVSLHSDHQFRTGEASAPEDREASDHNPIIRRPFVSKVELALGALLWSERFSEPSTSDEGPNRSPFTNSASPADRELKRCSEKPTQATIVLSMQNVNLALSVREPEHRRHLVEALAVDGSGFGVSGDVGRVRVALVGERGEGHGMTEGMKEGLKEGVGEGVEEGPEESVFRRSEGRHKRGSEFHFEGDSSSAEFVSEKHGGDRITQIRIPVNKRPSTFRALFERSDPLPAHAISFSFEVCTRLIPIFERAFIEPTATGRRQMKKRSTNICNEIIAWRELRKVAVACAPIAIDLRLEDRQIFEKVERRLRNYQAFLTLVVSQSPLPPGLFTSSLESMPLFVRDCSMEALEVQVEVREGLLHFSPSLLFPPFVIDGRCDGERDGEREGEREDDGFMPLSDFAVAFLRDHLAQTTAQQWHKFFTSLSVAGLSPRTITGAANYLLNALSDAGRQDVSPNSASSPLNNGYPSAAAVWNVAKFVRQIVRALGSFPHS